MFLRAKIRRKDGKDHRTWSIVENRRSGGRVVQRHERVEKDLHGKLSVLLGAAA